MIRKKFFFTVLHKIGWVLKMSNEFLRFENMSVYNNKQEKKTQTILGKIHKAHRHVKHGVECLAARLSITPWFIRHLYVLSVIEFIVFISYFLQILISTTISLNIRESILKVW